MPPPSPKRPIVLLGAISRQCQQRGGVCRSMDFITKVAQCAPTVHVDTMRRIVQVESGFNPYAIGIVGAHLQRQPRSYAEALATIRWLDTNGYNYSVGLAQVNRYNFHAHGLTPTTALMACPNLRAGGAILTACFARASKPAVTQQAALRAALSCYESGNFLTGFRDGYVFKILGSGRQTAPGTITSSPQKRVRNFIDGNVPDSESLN